MDESRITISLTPVKVVRVLGAMAVFLVVANLVGLFMTQVTGHDHIYGLVRLFDLDKEKNVPTLFSVVLFLINASLLFSVWWAGRTRRESETIWIILAGLFCILALDEFVSFHEPLNGPFREALGISGLVNLAWVIPYGIGCLVLAAVFFPVWRRMDRSLKRWLGLSAAAYLSGAIGVEIIGVSYHESIHMRNDWIYGICTTVEESLEMAGLILFVYSLLLLMQSRFNGFVISVPGTRDRSSSTDR